MAFHKILVANRGEIACRVLRTIHQLGYASVAVYSEADAKARHVQLADEALCIGPAPVNQSYLKSEAIIAAALQVGADAIHPGYGFLSENPEFARACAAAGICFIGPSIEAIDLMGSKRLSKIAMLEAGVPCIPGYEGAAQDDAALIQEATRIGYPLMIKASAGGGGRGMRLAQEASELVAQLRTARSEALNAFGSDELILERAVLKPRHVEIQIFGDQHGQIIYLGERDCSVQRRHQKVIEEAPCPVMTETLRKRMGEAAVQAAAQVNYVGAGTVEFLLDERGEFFFLEMNTRLQVEHPVTELITGTDLVAWQIRIAEGEPLPLSQEQVQLKGHAIEVRLYAEDPAQQFLPQTGQVLHFEPELLPGVRIDHGLCEGQNISPFYDPLLAKVIAHGATREEARRKLLRALEHCVLLGVTTNQAFLNELLKQPKFIAGQATTALIAEECAHSLSLSPQAPSSQELAIAAALYYQHSHQPGALHSWRNSGPVESNLLLSVEDQPYPADLRVLTGNPITVQVRCAEHCHQLELLSADERWLTLICDGVRRRVAYHLDDEQLWLNSQSGARLFHNHSHKPATAQATGAGNLIKAPMDGAIIEVLVEEGARIEAGQLLLVLEAMKMEHSLKAASSAIVRRVNVQSGVQVKNRQVLIELEPA